MGILFKFFTILILPLALLTTTSCSRKTNLPNPPLVSIGSLSAINGSNQKNYSFGGTCLGGVKSIDYTIGDQEGKVDCRDGSWEVSGIDLSGEEDGEHVAITVSFINSTGEEVSLQSAKILKDTQAPSLSTNSVEVPENRTYKKRENLDFVVEFDEVIVVETAPKLVLTVGGNSRYANYLSGSGTSSLTFRYVIQGTDEDNDGIDLGTGIVTVAGGLQDRAGNNFSSSSLTIPSSMRVLVDGIEPVLEGVTGDAGHYKAEELVPLVVAFSENVVSNGNPRLILRVGESQVMVDLDGNSRASSRSLTFNYRVKSGQNDSDGIEVIGLDVEDGTILDENGNSSTPLEDDLPMGDVKVDTVVPTLTAGNIGVPSNKNYLSGDLDFTVTFSEKVLVEGTSNLPRLLLTVGATLRYADYLSGSGTSSLIFRHKVVDSDSDNNGIGLNSRIGNSQTIKDEAGNNLASGSLEIPDLSGIRINVHHPVLHFVSGVPNSYRVGREVELNAFFNGAVKVLGTPQLILDVGGVKAYASFVSGSDTPRLIFRYIVGNTHNDADGVRVSGINLNGGTIKGINGQGVGNPATPLFVRGVIVDAVVPRLTGLSDDLTPQKEKTWKWGCSEENCTYRFAVNTQRSHSFVSTDTYASAFTVTESGRNETSYLHVQSKDVAGNESDIVTVSVVLDSTAPAPVSENIALSPGLYATYKVIGDHWDFTVKFTERVWVGLPEETTSRLGTTPLPRLELTVGANTRYANYLSGSGTQFLVFRYIIREGDVDTTDGIAVNASIDLNNATLEDEAGNGVSGNMSIPSLSGFLVDATRPVLNSVSGTAPRSYRANESVDLQATFDRDVSVSSGGVPSLTLTVGEQSRAAAYKSKHSSGVLLFSYLVLSDDRDDDGIEVSALNLNGATIKDDHGNDIEVSIANPISVDGPLKVDTSRPQLTGPSNDPVDQKSKTWEWGCSEDNCRYRHVINTSGSYQFAGNAPYSDIITASQETGDGTYYLHAQSKDEAGNESSVQTVSVRLDNTAPALATGNIGVPSNATYSKSHLEFTVRWSEDVIVTDVPRLTLTVGTQTRYADYFRGSGTRSLTFRHIIEKGDSDTADGISVATLIDLNGGSIKDEAGNEAAVTGLSIPSLSDVLVDATAVSLYSVTAIPGHYRADDVISLEVNFNGDVDVQGTPRLVLSVGGAAVNVDYSSGSGSHQLSFDYTVSSAHNDSSGISLTRLDLNGGTLVHSGSNVPHSLSGKLISVSGVKVDTIAPSLSSGTIRFLPTGPIMRIRI